MPPRAGQLDKETLRRAAKYLGQLELVTRVSKFPASNENKIVVQLRADFYPDLITEVRLLLELRTNGDFYIHYRENWSGEYRECRWDRHDNPHNSRNHYHPFPDSAADDTVDREFPQNFYRALEDTVLSEVEERWISVCQELE